MGFAQQYPRPYTQAGIGELDYGQSGVYGVLAESTWIYIGKGNIRERLLAHLKGDNACIRGLNPTHYVCEITVNAGARARELAVELSPICR
jgi:hypothetical protein